MAKSKLVKVNEKIAENVVGGYKKIENGVVGGYKKIEDGVVGGFHKISDKFVDHFLTQEGETVEEAKERLAAEQKVRDEAGKAKRKDRPLHQSGIVEANMQKTQNAVAEAGRKAGIES